MNKAKHKYRCETCETKNVLLWRGFGSWHVKEFKKIPMAAQDQFYNDIKGSSGVEAIEAVAVHTMDAYEKHEDEYAEH